MLGIWLSSCWTKLNFCLWAVRQDGLEVGIAIGKHEASAVSISAECTAWGDRDWRHVLNTLKGFQQRWLAGLDCGWPWHCWIHEEQEKGKESIFLFLMHCENIVCSERLCHKIPVQMLDLFKIDCGGKKKKNLFPKSSKCNEIDILESVETLCVFTSTVEC